MVSSRENYDPYASYATPTMTNQIQLDVYDSASQKAQQFGQEGDGLQGEGGSSILYEYDLVMIFPLREGGESKKPHQFGIEAFVSLMMGMDLEKSRKKDKIVIDTLHRVLRTPRCYLDDHGNENFTKDHHYGDQSEQAYLHIQKDLLEKEYEAFVGHRDITSELQFCELIATSISRRVQLACGLTTRMFRSCDNDEIIMTIKADDNDLRIEADRTNYRLQVSNKPFAEVHRAKTDAIRQEIGDEAFKESMDHLRKTRGCSTNSEIPEMDPLLMTEGETNHPTLWNTICGWGHTEQADGEFIQDRSLDPRGNISCLRRFYNAIFYISYYPSTYFSPFADYRIEPKFQPFFRRYPLIWGEKTEDILFTQKDRIRLAASIVQRHIGVDALQVGGYLTSEMFALHDMKALNDLRHSWALKWSMMNQPLQKIRMYFGEKISLYFAWLEFYTKMLLLPTIAGIIAEILAFHGNTTTTTTTTTNKEVVDDKIQDTNEKNGYILIVFAAIIVAWASLFSEMWQRKNHLFNAIWGMHFSMGSGSRRGDDLNTRCRAQFRGMKALNPINDTEEMIYENKIARRRAFLISIFVILCMIGIVLIALVGFFILKYWINSGTCGFLCPNELKKQQPLDQMYREPATTAVSAANALQIILLNMIYRGIAHWLNDLENHRTENEYENHLIFKVFLFQFCNSFASLFYIAFIKEKVENGCIPSNSPFGNCLSELRLQLFTLFLIRIIVGNILEVLIPYLKYKIKIYLEQKELKKQNKKKQDTITDTNSTIGTIKHNYVEEQAKLNPYEANESFEDYNEMVIQYGFITLFVVAFPLTPLLAFINNLIEIHVDAVKLCYGHRRPFPYPAKNIGAWNYIVRIMGYIALVTNTAIIIWTSKLFDSENISQTERALMFFVSCQVLVVIAGLIEGCIRGMPRQLDLLMRRFDTIVAIVFKGLTEGDDSHLNEVAEKLDLTIYPNNQWEDPNQIK